MAVFRVLSLDGGGMRGIYTAAFLARLSQYYSAAKKYEALDIGKGFDLITGTSTGAIVACAAAIGKPMTEVVDLYWENGKKIFPSRIDGPRAAFIRALFGGRRIVRKGDQAIRSALVKVLASRTMADVFEKRKISLSIPAVAMKTHHAYVFKKTPTSGNRDDKFLLSDVCLASTAAPIYRSLAVMNDPSAAHKDEDRLVFADGGLWANNPALVGMLDALQCAPRDADIQIFSLGTRPRPSGDKFKPGKEHRTMREWWLGAKIAPMAIAAQEFAYDGMANLFANVLTAHGRNVKWVRFPEGKMAPETLCYLDLDDSREEAMKALLLQASIDVDVAKSECDNPRSERGQMMKSLFEAMPEMPKNGVDWSKL